MTQSRAHCTMAGHNSGRCRALGLAVFPGSSEGIGFDTESLCRVDYFSNSGEGDLEDINHDVISV